MISESGRSFSLLIQRSKEIENGQTVKSGRSGIRVSSPIEKTDTRKWTLTESKSGQFWTFDFIGVTLVSHHWTVRWGNLVRNTVQFGSKMYTIASLKRPILRLIVDKPRNWTRNSNLMEIGTSR